jgi:quinolinate synthase
VVQASDYSSSTSAMTRFVEESDGGRYLLLTECAMGDNIAAANPDKEMIRMCSVRCPHMNEVKLQEVIDALRYNQHVIEVPEDLRVRAKLSIDRMLAIPPEPRS